MEDSLSQLFISVLISYNQRGSRTGQKCLLGPMCVWMHEAEDNSQRGGDQELGIQCQRALLSLPLNIARIQRIYLFYVFSEKLHFLPWGSEWIWLPPSAWSGQKLVLGSFGWWASSVASPHMAMYGWFVPLLSPFWARQQDWFPSRHTV